MFDADRTSGGGGYIMHIITDEYGGSDASTVTPYTFPFPFPSISPTFYSHASSSVVSFLSMFMFISIPHYEQV